MSQYPIIFRAKHRQPIAPSVLPSFEKTVTANPAEDHFFWYYLKPYFGKKIDHNRSVQNYTPDFIYIDQGENLYIDIECDEPYVYDTGEPTHYIKSDRERDRAFTENGWFVLRFAEQQIIESPDSCCQILAKLIARYTRDQSILSQFQNTPKISKIPFWTKAQAQQMAQERVRDRYLNQISNIAIDSLSGSTVLKTLQGFINTETDSQIRETKQIWRKPLSERVEDGTAIASLTIVDFTGNQITLRYSGENISKFSAGDQLRLSRDQPFDGNNSYSCVLKEETGNELILKAGYKTSFSDLSTAYQDWVLDYDIVDVRDLLIKALNELEQSPSNRDKILSILQGKEVPNIPSQNYQQAVDLISNLEPNFLDKQKEALASAIATQNYYLIQGPPGTGKTWLLAHLAKILASYGQRVLVTAFTHTAINNALRTIKEETGYSHVFKVGQEDKTTGLTWEGGSVANYEYFNDSPYSPETKGLIIGGTCFALRTTRLKGIEFDTVIFDEAGQVTIPIAIAGMLAGKRYIFIGDHKQMSPVITAQHQIGWVKRSIFETLFHHAPGTMLDITHRMNDEINRFPSNYFYQGKLQPLPSANQRRLSLNSSSQRFPKVLDPEQPSVFLEMESEGCQARSRPEANVIAEIITAAVNCGVSPEEIAVIAPFRAQVRLISTELKHTNNPELNKIQVNTVESMQGQQREMIIVSLTTSDPDYAKQRAEFYFQLNRLNVSITRAKTKRIVVGNPRLFEANPERQDLQVGVESFRQFYENSFVVKNEPIEAKLTPKSTKTMKTIAIYHNKGGVGKTTIAVNLAAALSNMGKKVLLIDTDAQANSTFATGLIKFQFEEDDDLRECNVLHLLQDNPPTSINQVTYDSASFNPQELNVVPSHIELIDMVDELLEDEDTQYCLKNKLNEIDGYDIVIVDTPPAKDIFAKVALLAADYLIIPSDFKPFSNYGIKNVNKFIEDINQKRLERQESTLKVLGIVGSKIPTHFHYKNKVLPNRKQYLIDRYNLPIFNQVIFDRIDLSKCLDNVAFSSDGLEIPEPCSIFKYHQNSQAATEINNFAREVVERLNRVS